MFFFPLIGFCLSIVACALSNEAIHSFQIIQFFFPFQINISNTEYCRPHHRSSLFISQTHNTLYLVYYLSPHSSPFFLTFISLISHKHIWSLLDVDTIHCALDISFQRVWFVHKTEHITSCTTIFKHHEIWPKCVLNSLMIWSFVVLIISVGSHLPMFCCSVRFIVIQATFLRTSTAMMEGCT